MACLNGPSRSRTSSSRNGSARNFTTGGTLSWTNAGASVATRSATSAAADRPGNIIGATPAIRHTIAADQGDAHKFELFRWSAIVIAAILRPFLG